MHMSTTICPGAYPPHTHTQFIYLYKCIRLGVSGLGMLSLGVGSVRSGSVRYIKLSDGHGLLLI